jgi:hypothetical protein
MGQLVLERVYALFALARQLTQKPLAWVWQLGLLLGAVLGLFRQPVLLGELSALLPCLKRTPFAP